VAFQKEEGNSEKSKTCIKHSCAFANKLVQEITEICNECIKLVGEHILPSISANDAESKTFFLKM